MKLKLTTALLVVLTGLPVLGQQSIFSEDFDGNAAGWSLHGLWAVDGNPSAMAGGAFHSGSQSLNFNNGNNYHGNHRASCQSPSIQLSSTGEHTLSFYCNYRTETTGQRYDKRSVVVREDGSVIGDYQLASQSSVGAARRCSAMGTWHQHEFLFTPSSAQARLQVEFVFDSVDDYANDFPGWFVDDMSVVAVAGPTPAVFDKVSRSTRNFQMYQITTEILANGYVEVRQSSPTARYGLLSGQATAAELQALEQAISAANLAAIPSNIPDPNIYIVAPTSSDLNVESQIAANHNRIGSSLGVYGAWAASLNPVMAAIETIQARFLAGTPAGDDHGDSYQNASSLDTDPSVPALNGAIDPAGDVDYFQIAEIAPAFAITAPPLRTYTIETGVLGNMDTYIELYASDGTTLLANNDDGGQGLASRIVHTAVLGSVMYVKVRHYSATGTGEYTIEASATGNNTVPGPTSDDHGNTPTDATSITLGGSPTSGAIDPAGDVDYFKWIEMVIAIFPPPQATYVIETSVVGNMDTILEIYAHDGTTLLDSNDDAPGLGYASRITYTGNAGSIGSVKVRHYSSTGTGSYTVSVKTIP